MKNRITHILAWLVLLTACPGLGGLQAAELVIGTSSGYPPYYYLENGRLKGLCTEIIDGATQLMGHQVVYRQYPWKRMLKYGQSGHVDAIMPLFKTTSREQYLYFPAIEIAWEDNSFFTRRNSGIKFTGSLRDLSGYPIGVVAEYSYGDTFDTAVYLQRIITEDEKHLVQMFKFNRFAIGLGNRHVIRYFVQKTGGIKDLVFLEPPVTRAPLYLAFSKARGHMKLAADFAAALQTFKKTAAYRQIMDTYDLAP